MTFDRRIFNFAAGPATLPEAVLKQAADEMLNWRGLGTSVLEISHRSKEFMSVYEETIQDLRSLMNIPSNYEILLLQGGGLGQNAAIPMNLMPLAKSGPKADYIVTGIWSEKSYKEAQKYGIANLAASSAAEKFNTIPPRSSWQLSSDAAYVLYCANEKCRRQVQLHTRGIVCTTCMSSDKWRQCSSIGCAAVIHAVCTQDPDAAWKCPSVPRFGRCFWFRVLLHVIQRKG